MKILEVKLSKIFRELLKELHFLFFNFLLCLFALKSNNFLVRSL